MFKVDRFYKHKYGVDAVICIFHVQEYPHGYEMRVTWHILDYSRQPMGPQQVQNIFVSKEDADDWHEYEIPS